LVKDFSAGGRPPGGGFSLLHVVDVRPPLGIPYPFVAVFTPFLWHSKIKMLQYYTIIIAPNAKKGKQYFPKFLARKSFEQKVGLQPTKNATIPTKTVDRNWFSFEQKANPLFRSF